MLLNDLPKIMLECLLITIVIEVLISLLLKIKNIKDLINIILVNIVTNPLVVTIPVFFNITYGVLWRHILLFILEICTVIFEFIIYKKYLTFNKINPFILSAILNLSSYITGEIINVIKYIF